MSFFFEITIMNQHLHKKFNFSIHPSSRHASHSFAFRPRAKTLSSIPTQLVDDALAFKRARTKIGKRSRRWGENMDFIRSHKERYEEWPPSTLQLDVGGRLFRIRRLHLSQYPGTRLGLLAHQITLLHVKSGSHGHERDHRQTRIGPRHVRHTSPATTSACSSASSSYLSPPNPSQVQGDVVPIGEALGDPKGNSNPMGFHANSNSSNSANIVSPPDVQSQQLQARSTIPNILISVNETEEVSRDESTQNKSPNLAKSREKSSIHQFTIGFETQDTEKEISRLCDECDLDEGYFYFDRNPNAFEPIADYYRTGALHLSSGVCFRAFQEELIYWGISPVCGSYT